MKKLVWKNLKELKCPQCGSLLSMVMFDSGYACTGDGCRFKITTEKFNEIVKDIYKPHKMKTDMERLSEWNNLGQEKVEEDFSDSPALDI